MGRSIQTLALAAVFLAPVLGRADEIYSTIDADGVVTYTNVPSDNRKYRKLVRTSDVAGVYKVTLRGVSGGRPSPRPDLRHYEPHIVLASQKYGVQAALIRAVMAIESNFNPRAVSEKGAMGLMQLMPATARELAVSDPFDPAQNIEGGARYLRILANQYGGDMYKILSAYNAGPEAVRRAGGVIPDIPETREYVRKVVSLYLDYRTRS